jgi:hypothetical protein
MEAQTERVACRLAWSKMRGRRAEVTPMTKTPTEKTIASWIFLVGR